MKKTIYNAWMAVAILLMVSSCSSDPDPVVPKGSPPPFVNRQDSLALVAIYKEGGGEQWTTYKWDLNDILTWGGVNGRLVDPETNEHRVDALHLACFTPYQVGVLSEEIGKLTELRVLLMDGEGFGGNLPASFSELKNLEEISIINTSFSGELPEGLLSLPKLELFTIVGCKLSGELPKDITETAPTVQIIKLYDNHLSGKIPRGIRFRYLGLDGNDYTEYPFEYMTISHQPGEEGPWVSMVKNKIRGTIPDSILNDPFWLNKLRLLANPQKEGYGFSNEPEGWKIIKN